MFNLPEKLELVKYDDPILHQECERFNFVDPQFNIVKFAVDLTALMQEKNALGLSANQVGVPFRIFAMNTNPVLVIINPRIVTKSEEENYIMEGCLSYPGLAIKVKRPAAVEARVNHPNGTAKTHKFENLTAHVFLHELDHLDGKTFFDAADKFHLESAERKWKALKRKII